MLLTKITFSWANTIKDDIGKKKGGLKTIYSETKDPTAIGNIFKLDNTKRVETQEIFIQPAGSNFE